MIENIICMQRLFNMLFVLTLILKLITLDTSSKFHSLIEVLNLNIFLAYISYTFILQKHGISYYLLQTYP